MKAYAIKAKEVVEEVKIEEPEVGPKDVLVDIHYVGLCGSDLNAYLGKMPFVTFPRIPGHEISGIVTSKGPDVPDTIQIGDKVTLSPYTSCGSCPACRQGRPNTCEFNQTLGVQRDGGLQSRISVPYEKIYTSSKLTMEELALVEPLSVGYHAANMARVCETDTVLIIGCGTIGMGALCAAIRKGASVIALDIDDRKLNQARKFGAKFTINSQKTDVQKEISEITNNEGVSAVIEAAGLSATQRMAVELAAFAGRIVYVGYAKSDVELNSQLIVKKELTISGSRNALNVFPSVINMIEKEEMPFNDMITKIFPFDQTSDAFEYWKNNTGEVSKVLINMK